MFVKIKGIFILSVSYIKHLQDLPINDFFVADFPIQLSLLMSFLY